MRHHMDDDARLIEAVRGGSLDALGELYRRHADDVHALAYRITGSRDDAADVLQDVFVGMQRALSAYREQRQFAAWLKQVTVRTSLMRQRSERRKRQAPLDDVSHEATSVQRHPLDVLAVRRALRELPDTLRTVFALYEIEGYSHAEIAALVGITEGNSATRLSRAWALLRKGLVP